MNLCVFCEGWCQVFLEKKIELLCMRHKESSIFPRGAMRRRERRQMTERCWRLRGELRGEQDHASTLEISHHLPSPSLKQKSKTFFCEFLYKPVKGPSLFTPAFFFFRMPWSKIGIVCANTENELCECQFQEFAESQGGFMGFEVNCTFMSGEKATPDNVWVTCAPCL